jgi:hypothetical protein
MGWLSTYLINSASVRAKGGITMDENAVISETGVEEVSLGAQQGVAPSFTTQVNTIESDIASLEAELLSKLTQKKNILQGEIAKVDADLSILGSLK